MKITGHLDIRKHGDIDWLVLSKRRYDTSLGSVTLLRGLICDSGSVPRAAWSALGIPRIGSAADDGFFLHDGLYAKHRDDSQHVITDREWTRKEADKVMYECHVHSGVDPITAGLIYRAVRLGAAWGWMTEAERKASRPQYDPDFLSM